jgi:hypothetical protein
MSGITLAFVFPYVPSRAAFLESWRGQRSAAWRLVIERIRLLGWKFVGNPTDDLNDLEDHIGAGAAGGISQQVLNRSADLGPLRRRCRKTQHDLTLNASGGERPCRLPPRLRRRPDADPSPNLGCGFESRLSTLPSRGSNRSFPPKHSRFAWIISGVDRTPLPPKIHT